MKVEYISRSLDDENRYPISFLNHFIRQHHQPLQRGSQFTGKTSTQLFADNEYVIKIMAYKGHSDIATAKWLERKRLDDIALGIYPAEKTWFLVNIEGELFPANITPRLKPLHLLAKQCYSEADGEQFSHYLIRCYDMVLRIAAEHNRQLDMGLSNFVIDSDQRLYYIDDDIYDWDRFLTFGQLLSAHIREHFSTGILLDSIAEQLCRNILKHFDHDSNWLHVLNEQMRSTFIPPQLEPAFDIFSYHLLLPQQQRSQLTHPQVFGTRVAILGDIHANQEALEAVLDDIQRRSIDDVIVLGDIVGYGPNPNECIERLRQQGFRIIKGNHDQAVARGKPGRGFSQSASWAINWTINQINEQYKDWLDTLPCYIKTDSFWCLHGSPIDPTFFNAYVYEMTYSRNLDYMQAKQLPLCFHGHTHIPGAYIRNGQQRDYFDTAPRLSLQQSNSHTLFSPGSVGQPRNQEAAAQYAIWDRDQQTVEHIRVEYDIQAVIDKMQRAGFPDFVQTPLLRLDNG